MYRSGPKRKTRKDERIGTNSANAEYNKDYNGLLAGQGSLFIFHVSQTNREEMRSIFEWAFALRESGTILLAGQIVLLFYSIGMQTTAKETRSVFELNVCMALIAFWRWHVSQTNREEMRSIFEWAFVL